MKDLIILAHNIRSIHNVGSIFRTADGLGIISIYLTGYTPYPKIENDLRLPHVINRIDKAISKVALGAEKSMKFHHENNPKKIISQLKSKGYLIVALEQTPRSIDITNFNMSNKLVLVLGNEVAGLDEEILGYCDEMIQINMKGKKESFNVVQAMAMASFYLLNK